MRSSLVIFVIGFVLGSSLGFGGMYTQVLQPTWHELEELERENGVMKEAVQEAKTALRDAAESLRSDSAPAPMSTGDITGTNSTRTTRITPEGDETTRVTRLDSTDRTALATRLESIAGRLDQATTTKGD